MDALLTTFLAALLGEIGDKTQLLAVLLGARYSRPAPVLAAIATAALANSALAAAGGAVAATMVPFRAIALMVAVALVSAGAGAFWRARPPQLDAYPRLGPFTASLFAFGVLEFGDKTQFLTFTLAARAGEPVLAAIGATAGILLAAVPAVIAGPMLAQLPLRPARMVIGALFLLGGLIAALDALRLI